MKDDFKTILFRETNEQFEEYKVAQKAFGDDDERTISSGAAFHALYSLLDKFELKKEFAHWQRHSETVDAREALDKKINELFKEYTDSCLYRDKATLICNAKEIYIKSMIYIHAANIATVEQAAYLLRFNNPLDTIYTEWLKLHHDDEIFKQGLTRVLKELFSERDMVDCQTKD